MMIADNLKSVVVGDKCEEEKEQVRDAFEQVGGVESVEQIDVHDYGFAHKAAVVEIVPNSFDDVENLLEKCNNVALRLRDENGIQVQIVLVKQRASEEPENK